MAKKRSNTKLHFSNNRSTKRQRKEESKTKFEDLPNELFYKIFSYLTDRELFQSFEGNLRFEQLILFRTKLNFRSIERDVYLSNYHRFNEEIIREIQLFNDDDTPGIIKSFFSFYSIDCFPNLQNLVLDQPEQTDLLNLMKSFDRLKHLSIRLSHLVRMPSMVYTNLYSSISSSIHLKSLTILDDPDEGIVFNKMISLPSLKYLTLGLLTFGDIVRILQSAPNLDSLKCSLNVDQSNSQFKELISSKLTRLDLRSENAEYEFIENLLKSTNKLKSLKLICRATNGLTWQTFIQTYLPNLIDFQFKFDIRRKIVDLIEYETSWWTNEKHWIVRLHPLSTYIYTIPLLDTKFILNSRTICSQRHSNEYSNIRQLLITLNPNGLKLCRKEEIYFERIEHLTLINYQNSSKSILNLQKLIHFNGIRHLTIDERMHSRMFHLLLEQLPQLNSLAGQDSAFNSITKKFQNFKLLSLIKLKIHRLSLTPAKPCQSLRYVSQLISTFSDIHQVILTIKSTDEIWFWLNHLINLRCATIFARYGSFIPMINEGNFEKFNCELRSELDIRLWIR